MGIEVAEQIAASVARRRPVNGIRIVGIDGRSGGQELSCVAAVDSHGSSNHRDRRLCIMGLLRRVVATLRRAGPLSPLLAGQHATFQARDWTDWYGSTLGGWKTQRWSSTVIVEGVTCTRRDTIGRIAYAIWVEAPAEMRVARGMARDTNFPGKEELWEQWMREEDEFFAADETRERADFIVDTSAFGVNATR